MYQLHRGDTPRSVCCSECLVVPLCSRTHTEQPLWSETNAVLKHTFSGTSWSENSMYMKKDYPPNENKQLRDAVDLARPSILNVKKKKILIKFILSKFTQVETFFPDIPRAHCAHKLDGSLDLVSVSKPSAYACKQQRKGRQQVTKNSNLAKSIRKWPDMTQRVVMFACTSDPSQATNGET